MTPLRSLWIMMLAFLVVTPAALAQSGLAGNPWIVFTVNTVIIWLVLFLAQMLLMRDVGAKEKTILNLASFLAALLLSWFLIGGSGYIWQVGLFASLFSIKTIINTVLITAIMYFGLHLLGIRFENGRGKFGMIVLLLIVAAIIGARMQHFLWDLQTFQTLMVYLFGQDGILRADPPHYRLFVFIGSSILAAWFFTAYLNLGGQGNNKLSYAMAIILGADLAHSGTSTDTIIKVGEIITILILEKQIRGEGGSRWMSFLISIGLVLWISSVLFEGRGIGGWLWGSAVPGAASMGITIILALVGIKIGLTLYDRVRGGGGEA